jgi:hypothetical protein
LKQPALKLRQRLFEFAKVGAPANALHSSFFIFNSYNLLRRQGVCPFLHFSHSHAAGIFGAGAGKRFANNILLPVQKIPSE